MKENNYLDNKYLLTMLIAKRAKQLNQGFKPLLEIGTKNNRLLALKEIEEGKVYVKGENRIQPEKSEENDDRV